MQFAKQFTFRSYGGCTCDLSLITMDRPRLRVAIVGHRISSLSVSYSLSDDYHSRQSVLRRSPGLLWSIDQADRGLVLAILHREREEIYDSLRPTMRIPFNNHSSLSSQPPPSLLPAGLLPFVRAIHDHLLHDPYHHRRFALPDNATIIHRSLYRVAAGGGKDSARKSDWQTRFPMNNVLSRELESRFPNPFRFDRIRNR